MNSACPIDCHDLAAVFNFKEWNSQKPTFKSTLCDIQVGMPWDNLFRRGNDSFTGGGRILGKREGISEISSLQRQSVSSARRDYYSSSGANEGFPQG
jgi:hypothetical protein